MQELVVIESRKCEGGGWTCTMVDIYRSMRVRWCGQVQVVDINRRLECCYYIFVDLLISICGEEKKILKFF